MKKSISCILGLAMIVSLLLTFPVIAEDEKLFTVDEVVVTATRYPVEMSETSVSMEVITEEEVQNTNAENVGELLNNVAGVNMIDNGGAGLKTIHIRGSVSSQVLVMMDGQPINNVQNGDTDLGQLLLSNIKRIEILKGPASAIYGANALGGVVNIITKDASQKPEVNFKVDYGSFNTSNVEFNYSASKEKTGLIFTVAKKSSDGHREIPEENSGMEQLLFCSKINYKVNSNSKLLFSFNYNNSEKEVPGMLKDSNSDGDYDDMGDLAGTPNATQDDIDKNINIKWESKKSEVETSVTVYNNIHELTYDNPDEWGYTGPSIHNTGRTGLELNRVNYLDNQIISYGLEFKNNTIDSNENGKHKFLNTSLYLHDEWETNKKVKVDLGVRYDDHEKFGSEISPRLGTVYGLNENTNLYFSAGKAYRTPTFNDLYWPADAFSEGNPDLEPETAVAYEAGIVNFRENMKTEVTIFNKNVDDMINWAAGDDSIWRPYNVASAIIKGAELLFEKQLSKCLLFNMNYTYLDAINEETEEQLTGEAKHNANIGLKYSKNDYDVNVDARYVAARAGELENYTIVDARLSKNFTVKGRVFEVALNINNLLNNEDYQINSGYPMPDRNYMLEVSTKF